MKSASEFRRIFDEKNIDVDEIYDDARVNLKCFECNLRTQMNDGNKSHGRYRNVQNLSCQGQLARNSFENLFINFHFHEQTFEYRHNDNHIPEPLEIQQLNEG